VPPLLLLQDIALTFGVAPVLSGAGLAVATGDRICLVGRNGSGKSTLLRIAAGLVQADAGERFAQPAVPSHHSPSHAKGSLGGDRSDDRQWDSVCKRGLGSPPPVSGCQPAADSSSFCVRRARVKKGNASTAADPCLLAASLGK